LSKKLFVLAGIIVCQIIDGSFFVPYLLTFDINQRTRCTACLYGMLSRIIVLNDAQRSLFVESDDKGKAKIRTGKQNRK
ncbi:MAG: hypothetical protein IKJ97_04065, partial [Bacteroidaceae bacterium]|nr:hypothetical protein [Bacteroidaceae bacterium]